MARHKSNIQYEKEILEVINRYRLFFIVDIFAYYKGCSRQTFYDRGLDKLDTIQRALESNKRITCQTMRSKWAQSDNPTLQIALYKQICSEEERRRMAQNYTDLTTNGNPMDNTIHINVINKIEDAVYDQVSE